MIHWRDKTDGADWPWIAMRICEGMAIAVLVAAWLALAVGLGM